MIRMRITIMAIIINLGLGCFKKNKKKENGKKEKRKKSPR
jgi:hypothetical protein